MNLVAVFNGLAVLSEKFQTGPGAIFIKCIFGSEDSF